MDRLRRLEIPMGKGGEGLVVSPIKFDGWARYFYDQTGRGPQVRIRLGRDPEDDGASGAIAVREVAVTLENARVGARVMRDLPLGRIEAAVNQPDVYEALWNYVPHGRAGRNLVSTPFPETAMDPDETQDGPPWWVRPPKPRRAPRLKLRVPDGPGKKPDEFYRQVADRYAYLATTTTRPANELAEANGVPVTTVHGWVKEARRRGLMPAADRRGGQA